MDKWEGEWWEENISTNSSTLSAKEIEASSSPVSIFQKFFEKAADISPASNRKPLEEFRNFH